MLPVGLTGDRTVPSWSELRELIIWHRPVDHESRPTFIMVATSGPRGGARRSLAALARARDRARNYGSHRSERGRQCRGGEHGEYVLIMTVALPTLWICIVAIFWERFANLAFAQLRWEERQRFVPPSQATDQPLGQRA